MTNIIRVDFKTGKVIPSEEKIASQPIRYQWMDAITGERFNYSSDAENGKPHVFIPMYIKGQMLEVSVAIESLVGLTQQVIDQFNAGELKQ